jgi:tetratricopeptide (TPR) repeat protein/tRNA A-37 threonylcarbamoyl transferase component Bud32
MPDYFKDARKALNEGDYLKAGDYLALAGDIQGAVDCYTMGSHYAVAARLLEKNDDLRRAAQYYAQASIFDKAATLYLRVEDYRNASVTFEKSGDFTRAADTATRSGDFARAAMMAEQANQLDKAAQYYNQVQNYERAAEIYERLLFMNIKERAQGEFLESVHNAIKKFGNNAGTLYYRLKNYEKSARCFEEAGNFTKCAEALSQLGLYAKAAEMFVKARDLKNASLMYEKAENIPRAIEAAEKSGDVARAAKLAVTSDNPVQAANLLVKTGKYEQAVEIYFKLLIEAIDERTTSEFPEEQRGNIKKFGVAAGNIYYRLKNYGKAGWCYEQGESYAKAAECYLTTNNLAKAGELYHKAQLYDKAYELLTSPDSPPPNPAILADVCFNTKRYTEAGDLYIAAGIKDRAAEAYELATNLYKASLLYEETENWKKAADLYSALGEAARAATLYERCGEYAEAAAYYESAGNLERATDCLMKIGEKTHAAILMGRMGKLEEAAPILQQITEDKSEYREASLMLGEFFANRGMESLALQKFDQVYKAETLTKGTMDVFYRLAVVYEKLGQVDKAEEIYEKLLLLQMGYKDVFDRLQKLQYSKQTGATGTTSQVWEKPPVTAEQETPPPPAESAPENGERIETMIGKRVREYDILELVGKGGMSMVFRARHVYLNKDRAIKIIQTELADAFFSDRFIQEARILADLHNPHLVQIFEFGSLEGTQLFMVLEWIEGESVKQRVQRLGRIPVREAIRIVEEAAKGLRAAHEKGIIHRDISPDNLMIVRDASGTEITKVIDFGIAKTSREGTHTRANIFLGKPEYASPEQCGFLHVDQYIDPRSDLYSLGITFYYMLVGKNPFSSPTPQGYLVKHISQKPRPLAEQLPIYEQPELFDRLICRMLQPERDKRHTSVTDFLADLDEVVKKRK